MVGSRLDGQEGKEAKTEATETPDAFTGCTEINSFSERRCEVKEREFVIIPLVR